MAKPLLDVASSLPSLREPRRQLSVTKSRNFSHIPGRRRITQSRWARLSTSRCQASHRWLHPKRILSGGLAEQVRQTIRTRVQPLQHYSMGSQHHTPCSLPKDKGADVDLEVRGLARILAFKVLLMRLQSKNAAISRQQLATTNMILDVPSAAENSELTLDMQKVWSRCEIGQFSEPSWAMPAADLDGHSCIVE